MLMVFSIITIIIYLSILYTAISKTGVEGTVVAIIMVLLPIITSFLAIIEVIK